MRCQALLTIAALITSLAGFPCTLSAEEARDSSSLGVSSSENAAGGMLHGRITWLNREHRTMYVQPEERTKSGHFVYTNKQTKILKREKSKEKRVSFKALSPGTVVRVDFFTARSITVAERIQIVEVKTVEEEKVEEETVEEGTKGEDKDTGQLTTDSSRKH